jgi:2-C-methyl-D-erythritol 4-phosphate cytidylyltransferase / 2-C-methyl-D-erythritol 2,4-cyclodiphosphate synthase
MEGPFADAVIVAAGASHRMGGRDKLEAPLLGRPLLAWTVEAMARAESVGRVIVVTAADRLERLANADWLREAAAPLAVELVAGGAQRSDSVRAGMGRTDSAVVLVHDGARPLASPALADVVARMAARDGAAIPIIPVADSLRRIDGGRVSGFVEREGVAAAQTPQGARRELLEAAFSATAGASYTDEAALLAAAGTPVSVVEGEPSNLKVTRPADLEMAAALLAGRHGASEMTSGYGQDSHPFGPDDGLWLGGLLLEEAPRLYGHSDGDVALHALASALLAAARQGDLGRRFPPTDPQTAGAASAGLLAAVLDDVRSSGWEPRSAQVSLLGARPRLGAARLEAMRERIGGLLGLPTDAVAVIASSGNLAGPEGAGLAISASAFVTLARR